MNGYVFAKNCRFDLDGVVFVVQRVNPDTSIVAERIDTGQVAVFQRAEILHSYVRGALRFENLSGDYERVYVRPVDELKESVQKEVERRIQYVAAIREEAPPVITPRTVLPIRDAISIRIGDTAPPSFTTLYRWLRGVSKSETFRSLIPRHDRRGPHKSYQPDRVLELFEQAAEKAFAISPQATIKMVHECLSELIEDENAVRPPSQQLKLPSPATSYRLFKRVSQYEQTVWREGKRIADRKFMMSGMGVVSHRILERVEMDHTPVDLFLVDESTNLPVGRPMLTVVLDHYSRMPLGYHVGYNAASGLAVRAALRHAILPKTFSKGFESLEIVNDWPCFGIPEALVVDNGLEFHGKSLEHWAFNLGVRLQYCPKKQPQFKGAVERFLKTINYSFVHLLPGTSFARFYKRGDYDPERHAILTLAQFRRVLEKWFVDVYANTLHRTLNTTPLEKWNSSACLHSPRLPQSIDRLIDEMGEPLKRSLRHDGITVHGLHYVDDALATILRRYGEGVRVTIIFDPADLGAIRVCEPGSTEAMHIVYAREFEYANGLTLEQHKLIRNEAAAQGRSALDSAALFAAKRAIQEQVAELMISKKHSKRRLGTRLNAKKMDLSTSDSEAQRRASTQPGQSKSSAVDRSIPLIEPSNRVRLHTFQMRRGQV